MKKLLAIVLALVMALGMVSAFAEESAWDGAYMDEDDFKAYIEYDLDVAYNAIAEQLGEEHLAAVDAAIEAGKAAIEEAGTVAEVEAAYDAAFAAVLAAVPTADGLYSYKKLSNAERTEILGILERYAVSTGITGVSLFENGGYSMYNPRVTLGTENYIVGYGFGILAEGAITADLEYETNPDWVRYYHIYETSDPGTLNYLNDQGAQVGDLYGYQGASFYTNFMNETKDGYDWVPELAKEKPVAVNDEDGDGMASTWRFEIRTGEADGLVYTTGSKLESRQAFNGRPVALEDYEYAFQLLLTQANNLYRGTELANMKSGAIAGAKDFYNATAEGFNAEAWENVGIKAYEEDGKNYFEVTFTEEQTQFYCMYYIASSLYMPVPQEFVELTTVKNYLGYNEDSTETPADNALTVGAYFVETYDQDQQIVYKKNPNYVFADTKYSIPGIHVKILTAAANDTEAALNEFLAEHIDAVGIPQAHLDEYRNDPRTRSTTGTSNFKLNVNACDYDTWTYLFGTDGVVAQNAEEDYWDLKPAVGNHHFIQALSYSIDRLTFANARGSIPSVDYLASNYMSDPENGLSYSVTEAHKKAVETLLEDTDGYGYSLELARDYFRLAMTELEAEGAYTPGTAEEPTVVNIEIAWMYPTHEEQYHNEIKNFIETAFNDESVTGGKYQLSVNFWVGNAWSDVYYNKMMVGQFDIGFGSISGNSLDPIGFVSVLSSDQDISGSFTLNWGVDTNDPDAYPIVYDDMRWSFDALYNAVNSQVIASAGQNKPQLTFVYEPIVKNEDETYTGSFTIASTLPEITAVTVTDIECCNYERYYNGDGQYDEAPVEFEVEDKGNGVLVVTFTVPAELAADYATGSGTSAEPAGDTGFDIYYDLEFNGSVSAGQYYSVTDNFEVPEVAEAPAEAEEAPAEAETAA
ncbi:MAG: hypothetical protein K5784_02590 [Clostridiales bacterium]|nr:hypothetical protein [Clostridiales bacterium]